MMCSTTAMDIPNEPPSTILTRRFALSFCVGLPPCPFKVEAAGCASRTSRNCIEFNTEGAGRIVSPCHESNSSEKQITCCRLRLVNFDEACAARTGRFVHFVCVSVFVCTCCSSESPTHYPSPRPHVETHGLIDLRQEFLMYTTKAFVFMYFVAGVSDRLPD